MAAWQRAPVAYVNALGQPFWFSFRPSTRPAWTYRRVHYRWTVSLRLQTPAGPQPFNVCFAAAHFPDMAACLRYLAETTALYEDFVPYLEQDWTALLEPAALYRDVGVLVVPDAAG
jgi:hypothetical protein